MPCFTVDTTTLECRRTPWDERVFGHPCAEITRLDVAGADDTAVMSLLAPGGVEVLLPDGQREIVAVDGGFISVAKDRVSVISEFARMAQAITVDQAERALAEARDRLDAGEDDDETRKAYRRAEAQLSAARKAN